MKRKGSLLALILVTFAVGVFAQDAAPDAKPQAIRHADIGRITSAEMAKAFTAFFERLRADKTASQGYVFNYGTAKTIRTRREMIMRSISWRCDFDCPRITFVDVPDEPKVRTELWIVPVGADLPAPRQKQQ